jgi:hypothetical protein
MTETTYFSKERMKTDVCRTGEERRDRGYRKRSRPIKHLRSLDDLWGRKDDKIIDLQGKSNVGYVSILL